MKNILNSIKEKISKHRKVSILVLLLFLLIGGSIGYVLVTNSATNSNPKVTQTNNQNKNPDTNATGSKDDKKNEVKEDKKEDKKVETTVEETKTTNVENNTTSTPTENNNTTNNTSNTVSNTAKPTSTPCVPTYTTVNHPEQGHYETQVVSQAWDEPVYARKIVGGHTGRVYNSLDEFDNQDEDGNYSVKDVQVDTIHHEAVTQQVWVVDQQAWTETVASGC